MEQEQLKEQITSMSLLGKMELMACLTQHINNQAIEQKKESEKEE